MPRASQTADECLSTATLDTAVRYDTRRKESFQHMNRLLREHLPAVTKKPPLNPPSKSG